MKHIDDLLFTNNYSLQNPLFNSSIRNVNWSSKLKQLRFANNKPICKS